MKNLVLASTLLASLWLVGCDPGSKSNGSVGATATTNSACPTGYWYSNGQCTNGTSTVGSAFSYNTGFYADNYSGMTRLNVVNGDAMKQFFKYAMGVCDRAEYNFGSASCDYFISGYTDIILQFPPQMNGNALVTIIARPKTNPYINYSGSLPSIWGWFGLLTGYALPDPGSYNGPTRNPLQIQMAVSAINNSAGFLAQGYGDPYYGSYPPEQMVVGIEVASGSANSTNLNFNFKVKGVTAASGVMTRCQTANCGL